MTVNAGNNDTLGVFGSADTANMSGTNSAVWIGGDGQTASNANEDLVHFTNGQGGTVTENDNSRVDVSGTGVTVNAGNNDTLGVFGSADTANMSGTNSTVWIGGNGENASFANDDHVNLTQGGTVNESDNSRLDVSGTGATINLSASDLVGIANNTDSKIYGVSGDSIKAGTGDLIDVHGNGIVETEGVNRHHFSRYSAAVRNAAFQTRLVTAVH